MYLIYINGLYLGRTEIDMQWRDHIILYVQPYWLEWMERFMPRYGVNLMTGKWSEVPGETFTLSAVDESKMWEARGFVSMNLEDGITYIDCEVVDVSETTGMTKLLIKCQMVEPAELDKCN